MRMLKFNQKCPWRARVGVLVDSPPGSYYKEVTREVNFDPCYGAKCPWYDRDKSTCNRVNIEKPPH